MTCAPRRRERSRTMTWWTKIRTKVEKWDGPKPKMRAAIALNFARNMSGVPLEELHLYRQDPEKHPDTPDVLPVEMDRIERRGRSMR